jgi:TonB family protein
MNPQRYIMPVIIAAGLHGALMFYSENRILPPPFLKDPPHKLPDFPPLEMTPEQTATPDTSGGAPTSLPILPEVPTASPTKDIFIVPVEQSITPITPVTELPRIPDGVVGDPGDGKELYGKLSRVISSRYLDRTPRATVRPAPVYPGNMRTTDGSVTVEFVVDPAGQVVTASAVRWTHREFVDSAVRAVLRWRFEPGTMNGRTVSFRMAVPIEFVATN